MRLQQRTNMQDVTYHVLTLPTGNQVFFYIKECAELFQQAMGGVISVLSK